MKTLILGIIAIIGFVVVVSYYKEIFNLAAKIIDKLRIFLWENKSFVDITFLIIYVIIQLNFLFELNKPNPNTNLLFTVFVIILLMTLGIERIFLRARANYSSRITNRIIVDYNILKTSYKATVAREKQLINIIKNLKAFRK